MLCFLSFTSHVWLRHSNGTNKAHLTWLEADRCWASVIFTGIAAIILSAQLENEEVLAGHVKTKKNNAKDQINPICIDAMRTDIWREMHFRIQGSLWGPPFSTDTSSVCYWSTDQVWDCNVFVHAWKITVFSCYGYAPKPVAKKFSTWLGEIYIFWH